MTFHPAKHRHTACLSSAKNRLIARAEQRSRRLGVNDKRVFEVLLSEHRSFSAYEVVAQDADAEPTNKRLQANQVYRAVETLIELGVAHRVESKNGYMACHAPDTCSAHQILICNSCDQVAELEHSKLDATIQKSVKETGFIPEPHKLELLGLCPNCADEQTTKN